MHGANRGAQLGRGVVWIVEASAASAPTTHAAASVVLARHGAALLRAAERVSLCHDDAEDALQRSIEILLTKAPGGDLGRLVAWMRVVVRREALAVRRKRERQLNPGDGVAWPVEAIICDRAGPGEQLERRERVARAARLLAVLKPQERRALALRAQGYSYAEISQITGWTHTKVNRCLAEGRARLRELARGAR
jgi:RNA polymerase sigma factor (sigma-70 family)